MLVTVIAVLLVLADYLLFCIYRELKKAVPYQPALKFEVEQHSVTPSYYKNDPNYVDYLKYVKE